MRSRLLVAGAAVYGLAIALIGLWSTPVDRGVNVIQLAPVAWAIRHLEITPVHAYDAVEFTSNIVLFVPLGALVLLLRPRVHWVWAVIAGLAISSLIEFLQSAFRPERFASSNDIIANTLGATIGGMLVFGIRSVTTRRRQERAS